LVDYCGETFVFAVSGLEFCPPDPVSILLSFQFRFLCPGSPTPKEIGSRHFWEPHGSLDRSQRPPSSIRAGFSGSLLARAPTLQPLHCPGPLLYGTVYALFHLAQSSVPSSSQNRFRFPISLYQLVSPPSYGTPSLPP